MLANPPGAERVGRASARRVALSIVGLAILAYLGFWWVRHFAQDRQVAGGRFWFVPSPPSMNDYRTSIDHTARVWLDGGDPYRHCELCRIFPYPPLITRLFGWVGLFRPPTAAAVWSVALVAIAAAGAWAAWRTRRELGLREIPLVWVLVATLGSTPLFAALGDGQCDGLILPFVLGAAWFLRRRSVGAEVAAGVLLAGATWVKYYPGVLILGVLALRRWRCLASYLIAGAAFGLLFLGEVRSALENSVRASQMWGGLRVKSGMTDVLAWEHSLSTCWPYLWRGTHLGFLARVPGIYAAAGILLALMSWVCLAVASSPRRDRLALPLFLWLVAAATFAPPMACDYNLLFLPLAALAVWDREDAPLVHALMGLSALWWQPFWFGIEGRVLFAFKVAGVVAVGLCLAARARGPVRSVPEPLSPRAAVARPRFTWQRRPTPCP